MRSPMARRAPPPGPSRRPCRGAALQPGCSRKGATGRCGSGAKGEGEERAGSRTPQATGGPVTAKAGSERSNSARRCAGSTAPGPRSANPAPADARPRASSRAIVGSHVEQREQRRRVPAQVGARGEQGPLPRPPLREAHHLAAALEDLARSAAGEAAPGRRTRRAPTGHGAPRSRAARRRPMPPSTTRRPTRPPPTRRRTHRRVVARDPDVEPELRARCEVDRSSPAAPPGQLRRRFLAAAWHPRAPSPGCCRAPVSGPSPHGRRQTALARVRNCSTSKRDSGEGKPQDAAARYGSHNGSTSDRCRNRQRCPSGGAGLTLIVQPSSESS